MWPCRAPGLVLQGCWLLWQGKLMSSNGGVQPGLQMSNACAHEDPTRHCSWRMWLPDSLQGLQLLPEPGASAACSSQEAQSSASLHVAGRPPHFCTRRSARHAWVASQGGERPHGVGHVHWYTTLGTAHLGCSPGWRTPTWCWTGPGALWWAAAPACGGPQPPAEPCPAARPGSQRPTGCWPCSGGCSPGGTFSA